MNLKNDCCCCSTKKTEKFRTKATKKILSNTVTAIYKRTEEHQTSGGKLK